MATREENIKRFENLLNSIPREGKRENLDALMNYIRKHTDFYTAPASTKYHLSCEGGLLQHSLNVYDCLVAKKQHSPVWSKVLADVPDESLIISALLHDLCKVNFYVPGSRNVKTYDPDEIKELTAQGIQVKSDAHGSFCWKTVSTYEIDDKFPVGHGEKSIMLIQAYIGLTMAEVMAIRWHMGYTEDKTQWNALGSAMEMQPLTLALYEADLEASKLLEGDAGNKMDANANTL